MMVVGVKMMTTLWLLTIETINVYAELEGDHALRCVARVHKEEILFRS
jgi:hypothetical protein